MSIAFFSFRTLGSIYTSDLLGVNYSLHNGLHCTKEYSHLLFGLLLCGLKCSMMGCVPIPVVVWTGKFMQ